MVVVVVVVVVLLVVMVCGSGVWRCVVVMCGGVVGCGGVW